MLYHERFKTGKAGKGLVKQILMIAWSCVANISASHYDPWFPTIKLQY